MSGDRLLQEALDRLPHGVEFRFLDSITKLDPGRKGAGYFTLKGGENFLKGHFPGQPMMPGVLLIESAAQLAGVVAQSDPDRPPLKGLKLAAVRNAKITGSATPGETLRVEATIEGRLDHLIQASAVVTRNGKALLSASLTLSGESQPSDDR